MNRGVRWVTPMTEVRWRSRPLRLSDSGSLWFSKLKMYPIPIRYF